MLLKAVGIYPTASFFNYLLKEKNSLCYITHVCSTFNKQEITMKRLTFSLAVVALLATSGLIRAEVHKVTSEGEFDDIISSHPNVVAEFSMQNCGACAMVKDTYHSIASNPDHANVHFLEIDVHETPGLTKRYEISGAPTFIYFNNGQKAHARVGAFQDPAEMHNDMAIAFGGQAAAHKEDMMAPEEAAPQPAESEGFIQGLINGIMSIIKQIIDAITGIISSIIQTITGIFGGNS